MLKVGPYKYNRVGGNVKFGRYANDQIAIQIVSNRGIESTATVALVNPKYQLGSGNETHCWLKGWSENEGLPEALEKAGIVKLTGDLASTGFVFAQLAKLTDNALREMRKQELISAGTYPNRDNG